jgi:hypothetical protein
MATESSSPERQPTYRDQALHRLMKELRADVRTNPNARATLTKVEQRLRFVLRVVELWDKSHAARAEELIGLGCLAAASTSAAMIFDPEVRANLYRRTPIGYDNSSEERIADAIELDREVLN